MSAAPLSRPSGGQARRRARPWGPPLYLSAAALGLGPLGLCRHLGGRAVRRHRPAARRPGLPGVAAHGGGSILGGKRVFGLEVVALDGSPLDWIRVALRVWLPLGIVLIPPALNLLDGPGFYSAGWMADGWTFSGAAVALDALSVLRATAGACTINWRARRWSSSQRRHRGRRLDPRWTTGGSSSAPSR